VSVLGRHDDPEHSHGEAITARRRRAP
jgi:hypothetical protein